MSELSQELLASLGELADETVANTGPTGDFVYVDISSIDRETKKIIDPKPLGLSQAPSRAKQVLKAGDVLVSMTRPNLNAVALVPEHLDGAIGSTGFHVLRSRWLAPQYLLALVQAQSFIDAMSAVVQGALYPAVRPRDISAYSFSFETPVQQARIVAKLEQLLSGLDAGVAELKTAQKKLKQYRQSLLKSAVEGELTAEWRAQQTSTETGEQLLQRILSERRARWEAKQLAKFKIQGKTPPKDWQKKYLEPVPPDTTGLSKLPEGWVWSSLEQLVAESSYGTSVKCNYESGGTPVLRIPNVSGGNLDLRDIKFSTADLGLGEGDYLAVGDVLVIRTNGSIGLVGRAAAVVSNLPVQHYFASYLLRLRSTEVTFVHRWILAVLTAHTGRQWLEARAASSAGQHNISLSTLLAMPVPLPPLTEQSGALTEVENCYELIRRQEDAAEFSIKQSAAQRQNILRAAFTGQLVPQDPSDEPASVLLARIRAERAERAMQPKVRKTKQQKEIAVVVSKLIDVLAEAGDWVPAQEAFRSCGVADGAFTDQIEALYAELRALDKAGRLAVEAVTDAEGRKLHDRLKLLAN
ncbi:hypothetical protein ACTACM_07615 [Pseudomonas fragariae (ex Marin et al. 2024)]|uniref:restriction endonuclease subunit S n=1 Tax=Pseudomonas TaxID=286 RepID=UPI000CEE789A|nr:restriction endonuclease subunit S [Pseudomonas syringae]PPS37722.1 hypothetical protein B0F86_24650 [Pseudomonas syringae]